MQHAKAKHPADHAGHFERELFAAGQPVDAPGDHALHGVRDIEFVQVQVLVGQPALACFDHEMTGIAQRQCQLLTEERVALGLVAQQRCGVRWQGRHAEPAADQPQHVV